MVKRLRDDVRTANDKLTYANTEIQKLLAIVNNLEVELSTRNAQKNQWNFTSKSNSNAATPDISVLANEGGVVCVSSNFVDGDKISTSKNKKRKQEILCLCGQLISKCSLHSASARCVECKTNNCALGFDNHCMNCFCIKFPIGIATMRRDIRPEDRVRNEINANFAGFIHNKKLQSLDRTHNRRIDHRLLIGSTIVAIETDEYAHVSYKKQAEDERYCDFMKTFSYKFVFIRFNPHANMESQDGKTTFEHKLRILMDTIANQKDAIQKGLNVHKLYIVPLFCGQEITPYPKTNTSTL